MRLKGLGDVVLSDRRAERADLDACGVELSLYFLDLVVGELENTLATDVTRLNVADVVCYEGVDLLLDGVACLVCKCR